MTARNSAGYDAPIGLAADPVVFTLVDGDLSVLLARRLEEPQRGMFALPGRVRRAPRSRRGRPRSASCARRPASARCTSSSCGPTRAPTATRAAGCPRSPTSRSCRRSRCPPTARPAARRAGTAVDALPELALDHATIVDDGLWRLRARLADKDWFVRVAGGLLTEPFTLGQAQRLYEALRGEPVDAANFRRDALATGLLEETGERHSDGPAARASSTAARPVSLRATPP